MKKLLVFILFLFLVLAAIGSNWVYKHRNQLLYDRIKSDFKGFSQLSISLEGFSVHVMGFDFMNVLVKVDQVKMRNTPGFKIPSIALIEDVRMVVNPLELIFNDRWQIKNLSMLISKVDWEINPRGELNIMKLDSLGKEALAYKNPSQELKEIPFVVERLEYKFQKLYQLDFRSPNPETEIRDLQGRDLLLYNITNPHILIQAPVIQYLTFLNQGDMGLPLEAIQQSVSEGSEGAESIE